MAKYLRQQVQKLQVIWWFYSPYTHERINLHHMQTIKIKKTLIIKIILLIVDLSSQFFPQLPRLDRTNYNVLKAIPKLRYKDSSNILFYGIDRDVALNLALTPTSLSA